MAQLTEQSDQSAQPVRATMDELVQPTEAQTPVEVLIEDVSIDGMCGVY